MCPVRGLGGLAAVAIAVLLCLGCGGGSSSPCSGMPTAAQPSRHLALFGAIDRLTARDLCRRLGRPTQVHPVSGDEAWVYEGTGTFVVRDGRVQRFCPPRAVRKCQ